MGQYYNPYISSYETMCLNIDAANDRSYPGSGNTCYDVSSFNNVGALTSVSFAGSGGTETFVFNGTTSLIKLAFFSISFSSMFPTILSCGLKRCFFIFVLV